jgi:hypothetical protein
MEESVRSFRLQPSVRAPDPEKMAVTNDGHFRVRARDDRPRSGGNDLARAREILERHLRQFSLDRV